MKKFKDLLQIIAEENGGAAAPVANSVSGGGIDGARGNPDETIIHQAAHLKRMKEENKGKKTPRKLFITVGSSEDVGRNVGRDEY